MARILRRVGRSCIAWNRRLGRLAAGMERRLAVRRLRGREVRRVNLCCGNQRVPGYLGVDCLSNAELVLDLATADLPFADDSLDVVVCMSAINYFTRARGGELVSEIFRALRPGGICRMGAQDMKALAERYVRNDADFFGQKNADGRDRFEGPTIGDKFAAWFYGYAAGAGRCEYFYDFDSLAYLFTRAGFTRVERRNYRNSRLAEVGALDNRPDQMFFLEAVK